MGDEFGGAQPGTGILTSANEIVTFIGTFSIGAKYSLPENDPDAIYVIIRDRKERPAGFDHTYKVTTGNGDFSAVVNGRTVIQVVDRQVLIDVTDGAVEDIRLKNVEPVAATDSGLPTCCSVSRHATS